MNAVDKPKDTQVSIRDTFARMTPEFEAALPPHIPVDRFLRVVMTAVNGNSDLLKADRRSLFEAAMKAAQDGLLPDGRDGALVIYKTKVKEDNREYWIEKVQWMPMIAGILKRVRNSGELTTISAYVAHENDHFVYILGDEEKIEHRPALGERGKPICVYAIAKTKSGGTYREVMTVSEVEQVRNVSRAKGSGPWTQWWGEMARKTVLRRLAKRLPMSNDLDDLIRRDDALYDFDKEGKGDHARLFKPVANPLSDEAPIQIDAETGEVTAVENAPESAASGGEQEAAISPAENAESPPEAAGKAPDYYAMGQKARRQGIAKRAIPPELRDESMQSAAALWTDGWEAEDRGE